MQKPTPSVMYVSTYGKVLTDQTCGMEKIKAIAKTAIVM